ncbi:MAG TPA: hypothetical protein VF914_22050 [Chloroflexia bacterium]|jgi:hypothetical protein
MELDQPMGIAVATLSTYVAQLPVLAVWVVGIVLALTNRHKQPRLSSLVLISLGTFLVLSLLGTFLSIWLPVTFNRSWSGEQLGLALFILGLVHSFIAAGAWIVLLVALFRGRTGAETPREAPTA